MKFEFKEYGWYEEESQRTSLSSHIIIIFLLSYFLSELIFHRHFHFLHLDPYTSCAHLNYFVHYRH